MVNTRFILYALLLTATWEGVLYLTIAGVNVRPYQPFLVLILAYVLFTYRLRFDWMTLMLGLYVISGIPGLMNSLSLSDSLITLFFSGVMVLICLSVRAFLDTSHKLEKAVIVWVLGIGNIINVYGLFQFVTWAIGFPLSPQFHPTLYPLYRPYSVFIEPNFYGNFLASQLAILIILWVSPAFKRYHQLLTLSAIPALFLFAVNQSRGPWLGLVFVIGVFILGRYLRRAQLPTKIVLWGSILAYTGIVLVIVVSFMVPTIGNAFTQRLRDTVNPLAEGAARDRVYDIQRSTMAFQDHPIIGNGVGTWGMLLNLEGRSVRTPPRNIVVAWLFEKGIVGASIGILLMLSLVLRVWQALRTAVQEERLLIWACFAGWMAVFFTFQFTVLEISPFYWIVFGFLLAATDVPLKRPNRAARISWTQRPAHA